MLALSTFSFVVCFFVVLEGSSCGICKSPQYLEMGKTGIVNCPNEDNVVGVVWFNTIETALDTPLVTYIDSVKSGDGYNAGEYDVTSDGSLIITNVSDVHDHFFSVAKYWSLTEKPLRHSISVIVTVKPSQIRPTIDKCGEENTTCFRQLDGSPLIGCSVRNSRPAVTLQWMIRTADGDKNISSQMNVTSNDATYTSYATTKDAFAYSSLSLMVCNADSSPGLLHQTEALILVQNNRSIFPSSKTMQNFALQNSKIEFNCTETPKLFLVWKRKSFHSTRYVEVSFSLFTRERFTKIHSDSYDLRETGSLVIPHAQVYHEGFYHCAHGDGLNEDMTKHALLVYVNPSPPYPLFEGCKHNQYCVLELEREGKLTCLVSGIRPKIKLNFATGLSTDIISFTDYQHQINKNGDTYDVSLTARYTMPFGPHNRVTVECNITGRYGHLFKLSSKVEMLFLDTSKQACESNDSWKNWLLLIYTMTTVVLIFAACGRALHKVIHRKKKTKLNSNQQYEEMHMLPSDGSPFDDNAKKETFLLELKAKYENLYKSVNPLPFIKDRRLPVNSLFVDSKIEFLRSPGATNRKNVWQALNSYHDIFTHPMVKSDRLIVEGEPGYGKTTFTLQLAHDWCTQATGSYLQDVDILILLRLGPLRSISSIFMAIKQLLLQKNTTISHYDIECIIRNSPSVVIVLDGFDEYYNSESDIDSHITHILQREMFQNVLVILTTRSHYLPPKYAPQTKRIRLGGFDSKARAKYIENVIRDEDGEASANKIKALLRENSVLADLCQVPLFFAMFAHISYEYDFFEDCKSVTSFFCYIISCFHSHTKNKLDEKNMGNFNLFETNHGKLDKIAFEGLRGRNKQVTWNKKDLCKKIGQELYDHYTRIGILVEEELLCLNTGPSAMYSDPVSYTTEVRFFHKLFCEWYAAHHLSEYASQSGINLITLSDQEEAYSSEESEAQHAISNYGPNVDGDEDYLIDLDPSDVQYLYRFACGLNEVAATKIIQYLESRQDAENFVVLCVIEKQGGITQELNHIIDLCRKVITINVIDSLLLQRSTIQFLEIASGSNIPISLVELKDCYTSVNVSDEKIIFQNGLCLPVLSTLKVLWIDQSSKPRRLTVDETSDILRYSSMCSHLESIAFNGFLLPKKVETGLFSELRQRSVEVLWHPYRLNLRSGLWEQKTTQCLMTHEEYTKLEGEFEEPYSEL